MPCHLQFFIPAAALLLITPVMARESGWQPKPVGIILNGMAMAEPGMLSVRNGHLLARLADLRQLGIVPASAHQTTAIDGQDFVALDTVPGITAELDADGANLRLSANPQLFPHLVLGLQKSRTPLSPIAPAQFLAYDIALSWGAGKPRLTGLLDAGVSGQWGVFGSTALLAGHNMQPVRLDTAYRHDFPTSRMRLLLGDTVSRPGPGGLPLRFGGFQIGTDFSLDPQTLNFALPLIRGSAVLPSAVELLSEAQRQSYEVGPGVFDVALQPRMTGAGQVTMNIRDITGATRQIVRNFYTSADILRPGLTDFTLEAGALRQGFGIVSNRYGPLFAAGGVRHALASWLTGQVRAETGGGTSVAGTGGTMVIGALGEVAVAGAVSAGSGRTGRLVRFQARRITPVYSLSATLESASSGFRPVGQPLDVASSRRELTLAGSVALGRSGGVNLAYASLRNGSGLQAAGGFSILSASYNASLFGGFFSGGVQRTQRSANDDQGAAWSIFGNYTITLGPRMTASAFAESGRAATTFSTALPDGSGWGMRALAGADQGNAWLEGSLAIRTAAGDFSMAASRRGTAAAAQATARGAFVRAGSTILATPRLDYGFALVDISGDDNVTVTVENRAVPRQGGGGRMVIVTGLQPYAPNRVGIDAAAIAIDAVLPSADQVVTPGWRQAAMVKFGEGDHRPGVVRLVDAAGRVLPVGASARGAAGAGVVGHDGEVWLEDFVPGSPLFVTHSGGLCRANLPATRKPLRAGHPASTLSCEPYIEPEYVF